MENNPRASTQEKINQLAIRHAETFPFESRDNATAAIRRKRVEDNTDRTSGDLGHRECDRHYLLLAAACGRLMPTTLLDGQYFLGRELFLE